MTRMLMIVLMMIVIPAHSLEYEEFEEYQHSKWYNRGQVVKWNYHLWVARLPVKERSPEGYSFYWSLVDLAEVNEWRPGKFYRQGSVVSRLGVHYLSRRAGFIRPNGFMSSFQWLEFNHPAIGYDLPLVDMEESKVVLEGFDSNFNGIRDDYEVTVIMTAENKEQRDFGLNSAAIFKDLFEIGTSPLEETSEEFASRTIDDLIQVSDCLDVFRETNKRFSGFKHKYFNTFDRLRVAKKADSVLFNILGNDFRPNFTKTPCDRFFVRKGVYN